MDTTNKQHMDTASGNIAIINDSHRGDHQGPKHMSAGDVEGEVGERRDKSWLRASLSLSQCFSLPPSLDRGIEDQVQDTRVASGAG